MMKDYGFIHPEEPVNPKPTHILVPVQQLLDISTLKPGDMLPTSNGNKKIIHKMIFPSLQAGYPYWGWITADGEIYIETVPGHAAEIEKEDLAEKQQEVAQWAVELHNALYMANLGKRSVSNPGIKSCLLYTSPSPRDS